MRSEKNLWLLALGVFGITTTEFGVIGVLPDIAAAFHVTIDKAGWLLSAFALIVAFFGPFMMMLFSKTDRKSLLLFSLLLFAVANVLSAFAMNFYQLLLIRMLPAFFHPVYWSIALSFAINNSSRQNTSKAVSIIFSGLTVATVLGVPLATFVSAMFNWQGAFLLTALINVVAFAGVKRWLPPVPADQREAAASQQSIFRNGLLWINLMLAFFIITAMYATYGYMADFLRQVSHMNGSTISMMLLLFGVVGIGGNYLAGRYMSRQPYVTTLLFLLLLSAVHVLLYWLGGTLLPMVLLIAVWGLIHAGGFLISNIQVTSSVPEGSELINSIFTSCGNFAVTAGALLGGHWIAGYGIANVVWASVGCLIIALLVLLFKRLKYRRPGL
ncbi:Predicted arabinose efflux permease, MFS family [Chitinophaga eiseniae]|uniref:Predicted arabinose efflux permease, MFS family n=1 Tax=Chitinophaga eiseniae TaxID=634771 RepID=A0A1T4N159_9BACT|nr:MFS transporter [Chitinophaga eiseniae]SJZ72844.1 Predicted arabinose efflux permease, MFS family [Chitinophaga eiseniae]